MRKLVLLIAFGLPHLLFAQETWTEPTFEFPYLLLDLHVAEDGTVFAAAIGGLYRSTDQAETWELVYEETTSGVAETDGKLYAATDAGLIVSSDGGAAWAILMHATAEDVWASGNRIVVGGRGGQLYLSDDAGSTWSVPNCELMPEGFDFSVSPVFASSDLILYGHFLDGLFSSADDGTWTYDDDLLPSFFVSDGEGTVYTDDGDQIIKTVDGETWSVHASTPFFSVDDLDVQGDLFAASSSFDGVAVSSDGGQTWVDWTDNLEDVDAVAIDPEGHVYVVAGDYVHRSVNPIPSGSGTPAGSPDVLPVESEVSEIYPNPINGEVTLVLTVARDASVEVEVFDALGRRVDVLLSRHMPAGRHKLKWSPSLANGTYFVRMRSGDKATQRSVTVAR